MSTMAPALWHWLRRRLAGRWRDPARGGQALVLGALLMTVLVAFTGLTVDVGVWLVAKARLQRAVDAAALSVILDRPAPSQTGGAAAVATVKSRTIIVSQGVPDNQIISVNTSVPRANQLQVTAQQRVPTAFAKVIGVQEATIGAQATADINAYIEIPVSPLCGGAVSGSSIICDGGVGDSTMDQFGINRAHTNGDAYTNPTSPYYNGPDGNPVLPEGYLYRVHVEAGYTGALDIQVWDPDNFNQNNPPQYLDPCGTYPPPCNRIQNPTYSALNDTRHPNPSMPSVAQNYYAAGYHLFWRVDECNGNGQTTCQGTAEMTPLEFTLWYLDPDALDPLNPLTGERTDIERVLFVPSGSSLTCSTSGSSRPAMTTPSSIPCTTFTYTCTAPYGSDSSCTDLRWVRLFHIPDVTSYPARVDGTRSFFIYVRPLGSTYTENVYHLRSGPPPGDADQASCQKSGVGGRSNYESVNNQINCQWQNGRGPGANTKIYARRSMPVNVMQAASGGVPYIVWLGYIPKTAAGQTLRLRNYDLDRPSSPACPPGSSATNVRYMAYFPSDGRRTFLTETCGSANGVWQEDLWTAPAESDSTFWGADEGFWLYADVFQKTGTYPFWDTAVFEVIFNRARLIR
jgi:Flp pilus assembly protein TadG